jgi:uncharacterized protein YjbI with pentapeptide repeats
VAVIIRNRDGKILCDTDVEIDLSRCSLQGANFRNSDIGALDLSDTDLRGADFTAADLYWTFLFQANCEGSVFQNAHLSGVVLDGANLRQADLTGAYISYDNLQGSSTLKEADLTGALLEGADLRGSKYSPGTIFPAGFDPIENGMIFEEEEQGLTVPTNIIPIEEK